MASESVTVLKWNEKGVFKYFKFTPAVLEEFTISDNLTHLESKGQQEATGIQAQRPPSGLWTFVEGGSPAHVKGCGTRFPGGLRAGQDSFSGTSQ